LMSKQSIEISLSSCLGKSFDATYHFRVADLPTRDVAQISELKCQNQS